VLLGVAAAAVSGFAPPSVSLQRDARIPPPLEAGVVGRAGQSIAGKAGNIAKKGKAVSGALRKRFAKTLRGNEDDSSLKICLLVEPTPFTHVCGYANRFQEMLKYLKEFGDAVEIATPDDKPEAPSHFMGFPITTLRGLRLFLYPDICLTFGNGRGAMKMIERMKPDLIHVSTPGVLCVPTALYAKLMKIPLVMSYHTHLPVYADRYMGWVPFSRASAWQYIKRLHSFADVTLVTSPQMQSEFRAQNVRRVRVWQKGVDTDVFHPRHRDASTRATVLQHYDQGERATTTKRGEARRRQRESSVVRTQKVPSKTSIMKSREALPVGAASSKKKKEEWFVDPDDDENTILLYVGRLSVEKRLDQLAEVLDSTPETVKLALVGGGPHEAALKKHFERFGNRVTFCGILRGEQLSQAYASADIFCMPSDSETLGFVVIEAMASGLAVVAARAGGIPSIVDDGKNGVLAAPRDPEAFASAVRSLVSDSQRQLALKQQARKDSELWGWKQATRHLRDVHYKAAIRHKARRQTLKTIEEEIAPVKVPFLPYAARRALRLRLEIFSRDLKSFFLDPFRRSKALRVFAEALGNFTQRFILTFSSQKPHSSNATPALG